MKQAYSKSQVLHRFVFVVIGTVVLGLLLVGCGKSPVGLYRDPLLPRTIEVKANHVMLVRLNVPSGMSISPDQTYAMPNVPLTLTGEFRWSMNQGRLTAVSVSGDGRWVFTFDGEDLVEPSGTRWARVR